MKKITLLLAMLIGGLPFINAQNTIEVDANAAFVGYANVFDLPADGGAYVFGDVWGVPDLKTVIDAGAGTITLQPNFSAWDPADPFWVVGGEGNKTFEGNTYVEDSSLTGEELTFIGGTVSNTIDAGYEVVAFIKVFNADFSVLKIETASLVAGENFSITYTDVEPADAVVQYGFQVTGPNADPADEAMLGSVVVSATILGTNDSNLAKVSLFPNPATSSININADEPLESVRIFNVLGQEVINITTSDRNVSVDISSLQRGVYLADVVTSVGSKTIKFIKE
jgi:hypothetical protein